MMSADTPERGPGRPWWQEAMLQRVLHAVQRGQRLEILMPRRQGRPPLDEDVARALGMQVVKYQQVELNERMNRFVEAWVRSQVDERRRTEEALVRDALANCDTLRSVERLHLVDQDGCAPAVASSWWPT